MLFELSSILAVWFVDEQFLGKTDADTPFYWDMQPGTYTVRVIDDHGRVAVREVEIRVSQ